MQIPKGALDELVTALSSADLSPTATAVEMERLAEALQQAYKLGYVAGAGDAREETIRTAFGTTAADELPAHLQERGPPTAICDTCHRSTWDSDGTTPKLCLMTQPDGKACKGYLRRLP